MTSDVSCIVLLMTISCMFNVLVPRPHLSFEAQLVAGKFHELRPIKCMEQPSPPSDHSRAYSGKQKHDALTRYPQRIRRLNIFPANKMEVIFWFVMSMFI